MDAQSPGLFLGIAVVLLLVIIAIYVLYAMFLNNFNKLVYGKGTALAWIPGCNIYLLGKLTVNKIVGWVLVVLMLLSGSYTTTVNGVENTTTILPQPIGTIVSSVYSLAFFGLLIYAIIKYNKLKKEMA